MHFDLWQLVLSRKNQGILWDERVKNAKKPSTERVNLEVQFSKLHFGSGSLDLPRMTFSDKIRV